MSSLREAISSFSVGGELDIRFDSGTPFVGKFIARVEATEVSVFCDTYRFMLSEVNVKDIYVPDEQRVNFDELQELHEYIEEKVTERVHAEWGKRAKSVIPAHFHA